MKRADSRWLVLANDRIEARFDLKRGCRLAALKGPGNARSRLSQTSQILVSGIARADVLKSARVLSVRTGPIHDRHMGPGRSATVRMRIRLDRVALEVVRHVDLPDGAGALRILDFWHARQPLSGVWYSELGSFAFPGGAKRPVLYDWVSCSDQTNYRLIARKSGNRAPGVLTTTGTGLFFGKEGPVPDSRPIKGDWDFEYREGRLTVVGTGFDRAGPECVRRCDGLVIGWVEDAATLLGLRRWQRARYDRKNPAAAAEWVANSWPAFHLSVDEEKIRGEIAAAAECGIDAVTIDDGWAKTFMGEVDREKFPSGLEALSADAMASGVQLGLWMNPLGMDARDPRAQLWDGAECHDIRKETRQWNWVARTLDFQPCETCLSEGARGYVSMDLRNPEYAEYLRSRIAGLARAGIRRYKFDLYQLDAFSGMTGDAHAHYEAYRRFLDDLKDLGILVEMDVTRGNRPCFDFGLDYGRLFLENRGRNLKDHRWYQPWISLANLWDAARLAPAQLLELEVLPQLPEYPMDYVLSTALAASPLYFGSLCEMSPDRRRAMRAFIESLGPIRRRILSGLIVPVGARPEKDRWSGFASIAPDGASGVLIAYRNGTGAPDRARFDLSRLVPAGNGGDLLAGSPGARAASRKGRVEIHLSEPLGFAVVPL